MTDFSFVPTPPDATAPQATQDPGTIQLPQAGGQIQTPGISLESTPEQVVPPTTIATPRAEKYDFALGDKSPGKDQLLANISSGLEGMERQHAAAQVAFDQDNMRQNIVRQFTQKSNGVLTPDDIDTMRTLSLKQLVNPDTVMEKLYARRVLLSALTVPDNGAAKDALDESSEGAHRKMDAFEALTAKKEIAQHIAEEQEQKWKDSNWLNKTANIAETFVPFFSWWNTQGAVSKAPSTSLLPGNNWADQIQYLHLLSPDDFQKQATAAVNDIATRNKSDAMEFAQALTSYSTSDQNLKSVMALGDVASVPGTGLALKVAKTATGRLTNNLVSVAQALGKRTTSVADIVEATGDIAKSSAQRAADQLAGKAANTAGGVGDFKRIQDMTPSLFNPGQIVDGPSGSFDREATQRLKTFLTTQADRLLGTATNPISIDRLSADSLAVAQAEAKEVFNVQYPKLSDAVLNVRPIGPEQSIGNIHQLAFEIGKKPAKEITVAERAAGTSVEPKLTPVNDNAPFGGTAPANENFAEATPVPQRTPSKGSKTYTAANEDHPMALEIGTKDAHLFDSPEQAKTVGTDFYNLKSFEVKPKGNGYYIEVRKAVDETLPSVRNALGIETTAEQPKSMANMFLGFLRSADDKISEPLMRDYKAATYGSSNLAGIIKDSAKEVGTLSRKSAKDMDAFLSYQRDYMDATTGNRGRFSQNLKEFETEWMDKHGRLPTEKEAKAYFTYTQLNDLDSVTRNMGIFRDRSRLGIEDHFFGLDGVKSKVPYIQGKVVKDIPWDYAGKEGANVMVWDKGGNHVIDNTKFMRRGKDLAPATPEVPAGHVRMYHGGGQPGVAVRVQRGGEIYFSSSKEYAQNYRGPGSALHYVDVPEGHPILKGESPLYPGETVADHIKKGSQFDSKLPYDLSKKIKLYKEHGELPVRNYLADGKPTRRDIDELTKEKGYRIVQLSEWGDRDMRARAFGPTKRKLDNTGGQIHYVIVKDLDSRPIQFQQIPHKPGGHVDYKRGFMVSQPNVSPLQGDHVYFGDKNVLHFETESRANKYTARMNTAHDLLNAGDDAKLGDYLKNNLPWSVGDFKSMYHPEGSLKLSKDAKFYTRPMDTSIAQTHALDQKYPNFRDSKNSHYNLEGGEVNLKYAGERGDTLSTIVETGSKEAPGYNLQPAKLLDPASTLNRATSAMVKGRYLDDLKTKVAEQFVSTFGHLLKGDLEDMARNPIQHLMNPVYRQGINDRAMLSTAKNFQRTAAEFLNIKNDWEKNIGWLKAKILDGVMERFGDKAFQAIEPLVMGAPSDPFRWMRSVTFHMKLGLFNPVQTIMQAQTVFHMAAIEGPMRASRGVGAATLMRYGMMNEAMIPHLAEKAASAGLVGKAEHFVESWNALKRTGFNHIGKEVAQMDDFLTPKVTQGRFGQVLDAGNVFFNEGERTTRLSAWNASYERWRVANPNATFNDAAIKQVLNRADLLTGNMSSASRAMWQKGILSVPTQFWAYQMRIGEQLLGGRLNVAEKARVFAMYSSMYGIPVAATAFTPIWPLHESIKDGLLSRGINTDDNTITKVMNDGLQSMLAEYIFKEKFNTGTHLGPNGISFFKDLWTGDSQKVQQAIEGASISTLRDWWAVSFPLATAAMSSLGLTQEHFPLNEQDLIRATSEVSVVNNALKTWYAYNLGKYISKNEMVIGDKLTGPQGIFMTLTGSQPQSIDDAYAKMRIMQNDKANVQSAQKQMGAQYRLGFRAMDAKNEDEAIDFMKRAKAIGIMNGLKPDEMSKALGDAFKGYESLVDKIDTEFAKSTPERLQAFANKYRNNK